MYIDNKKKNKVVIVLKKQKSLQFKEKNPLTILTII